MPREKKTKETSVKETDTILSSKLSIDVEDIEAQRCEDSFEYIFRYKGAAAAANLFKKIQEKLTLLGVPVKGPCNTPYVNTILSADEPKYPGNIALEKKIRSAIRWNAMSMVVSANRDFDGLGGHISTYASVANLYEVGFQHFFRGKNSSTGQDLIYFQGHASPGNYARAFVEGRLTRQHLHNFRQELAKGGGLSSYPHPYLMPNFWQFPTVSMGLGPIMAIYQARFSRYLSSREFIDRKKEPRVWAFLGDGETDEPESLGALSLASREKLDNLIFIVNCNLQRLDGPVRGNGKIIQELESVFTGAGWNVIKVIWGSDWDHLLEGKYRELLIKRMGELVDGEIQHYAVSPGSYIRKNFFGKYPELLEAVSHLTDKDLQNLSRGGHDSKKVFAGFQAAIDYKDGPSVILAQTIKGYGLGEAGEGKNISHNQKKMNEKELREFRKRFEIPIDDEKLIETPFYKPPKNSQEMKYYLNQREKLGGFLPERTVNKEKLTLPDSSFFKEFLTGSAGRKQSTTMAFVRILTKLLRNDNIGRRIVPIIPDEARTFGMESLFRQIGIYSSTGQLYEPVDKESLLYYREEKDGQILEEGINEAGSMSSFIAAGTSYTNYDNTMIPFYIYYSMFGFQRVGDLIWLAGDIKAKGFLIGGTSGRTTLNGEGLQHQDGHSLLIATSVPSLMAYDVTFSYEIAVIIQDGLRRMYGNNEEIFYYLAVCNENYEMLPMPEGIEDAIINGLYKLHTSTKKSKVHIQLVGSGTILREALVAKDILESDYGVSCDVWSATSYKRLRSEAQEARRWNMLHPDKKQKKSYLEDVLEKETGVFVAVSDNVKLVSDQIAPWVPGGLFSLGTDGFGRSDTRENLRRFFEVDAACTVIGALYACFQKGLIDAKLVKKAIKDLKVNPEKVYPICL